MAFIEERLLDCVSYGTSGGPTWRTRRISLNSGVVRRNAMRSRPLYRFSVLYKNLDPLGHKAVYDAFNACMGGLHSFRLKDWHDFEAVDEQFALATGSSQTVQLTKTYSFGAQSLARPIRKPVSGTVTLKHNGTPFSPTSVDYTTGLVTFTTTAGHVVSWSGEFDVPVMFEEDELPFSGEDRGAAGLFLSGDVMLVEDTAE